MNRCTQFKPKLSLKPVPVPSRIFAQIGMDLMHMNPCHGFNYIITAVDYLSKYCEMWPLKQKSAKEVACFIYEDLICRWGCSEYHITDQGREFVNATNKELLEICGTKQRITSSYHPQANGLSERLNRTTRESLVKSLGSEKDWVSMIPTIAFSHRSSMNGSTRMSPLEMILGHKPRFPIDIQIKFPTEEDLDRDLTADEVFVIERECLDFNIQQMKTVKNASIGRAKVNITNAQIHQKRIYDKRFENKESFNVGDIVLLENQINKNRKGGKTSTRFSGPYKIEGISNAGNCTLRHEEGTLKKTKHPLAHLKLYHDRNLIVQSDDESEIESENTKQKQTLDLNKKENAISKSALPDPLPDIKLFSDKNFFLQTGIEVEQEEKEKEEQEQQETVCLNEKRNPNSKGNVQSDYNSLNFNSPTHAAHAPVKRNKYENVHLNFLHQMEHRSGEKSFCIKPKEKYIRKRLLRRKKLIDYKL